MALFRELADFLDVLDGRYIVGPETRLFHYDFVEEQDGHVPVVRRDKKVPVLVADVLRRGDYVVVEQESERVKLREHVLRREFRHP